MAYSNLWKYCTATHCNDLLVSMDLLAPFVPDADGQLACLYELANCPEPHYRTVRLLKRDGSFRRIDAPDFLMKTVQSNLLCHFLQQQPVSPYATAYFKNAAPAAHARLHVGAKQLLKLDIKDFFPNITFAMVLQAAFPNRLLPPAVAVLLTNLCCLRESLPQGSPASPYISNLVMRPFDDYMGEWCGEQGIHYGRYCDDMVFSGDFDCEMVLYKARGFLSAMGFSLNSRKTCIISAGQRQTVTGVVVNEKAQVCKDYRKKIRQEMYYCRKFGIHSHLARCHADTDPLLYLNALSGRINWVLSVNPKDTEFCAYRSQIREWLKMQSLPLPLSTVSCGGDSDGCGKPYTPHKKTIMPR